ncbi:MAG: hypothetical protein M3S32_05695 [Acidobacteriota bacterium]|nr:hypothetical protein [Acidobacteriota bacterium]
MKVAVPVTVDPLRDSRVALAEGPSADRALEAAAGVEAADGALDEEDAEGVLDEDAHPAATRAKAASVAALVTAGTLRNLILSSFKFWNAREYPRLRVSAPSLMTNVAPIEVSRLTVLALVAGGVVVALATGGDLSHFAGGFAAGAGAILVLARVRRGPDTAREGPSPGESAPE